MTTENLITYGCSYTQGIGLSDLSKEHSPFPSKLAWPALLASRLDVEVENHGRGGWSNKLIAHTMIQDLAKRKPGDLVIVMWTSTDRYVCLRSPDTDPGGLYHVGIWQAPIYSDEISEWPDEFPEVEAYFRHLYHPYDSKFHDLMMITAVNRVYEQAGIHLMNVCMPVFHNDSVTQDHSWFIDHPVLVFDEQYLLGSTECFHPNEASHEAFTERLAAVVCQSE